MTFNLVSYIIIWYHEGILSACISKVSCRAKLATHVICLELYRHYLERFVETLTLSVYMCIYIGERGERANLAS
jgi:hypothetical protein